MPSNFPTSLDSFPTLTPTTRTDTGVPHAALHALADSAIAALEAKVGIDGSGATGSMDYLLSRVVTRTTGAITGSTTRTVPVSNGAAYLTGVWIYGTDGTNALYGQVTSGGGSNSLVVTVGASQGTINSIATGTLFVIAGAPGTSGGLGATGATGPAGTNGTNGAAGPGYLATSATSLATAGTGSKAFTTQAGLAYTVGARVRATSVGTGEWMEGVTTAYTGTTLTVGMDSSSGTGTHADWNINLAGQPGIAGATGATGATGSAGSGGGGGSSNVYFA